MIVHVRQFALHIKSWEAWLGVPHQRRRLAGHMIFVGD